MCLSWAGAAGVAKGEVVGGAMVGSRAGGR